MKKKMMITSVSALVLAVALAGQAAGQEEDEGVKQTKEITPLRVQVTFSRYQGEKKVGSMPYTLAVNADDRPTVVRAGVQVPIMVYQGPEKGATVMYKDVGNNLDCSAHTLGGGRFKLSFTLEQGSVQSTDGAPKAANEPAAFHAPVLRTFRTQSNVILRDGQSAQYVAATDPVSGEMVKIDVTLNLVK